MTVAMVTVGCSSAAGDAYRGGVLDDPVDIVTLLRHEIVLPDDDRAAGPLLEEVRGGINDRTVTIARRAEFCSRQPDVLVQESNETLKIRMIVPTVGVPCQNDESHVVTLVLSQEFESYEIG